jgi:hypothetical protein
MCRLSIRICVVSVIILAATAGVNCQSTLPDVLKKGTMSDQFNYLNEHTRIYENYRAIREDMYRLVSRNALDTMKNARNRINGLVQHTSELDVRIDSLRQSLEALNTGLLEMTKTKNSIPFLGMEVNKKSYNTLLWSVIGVLAFLLAAGYLTFRQHRAVTLRTRKELESLKAEFEAYRTKTRLEREKTNIDHFNEIKKLRGR